MEPNPRHCGTKLWVEIQLIVIGPGYTGNLSDLQGETGFEVEKIGIVIVHGPRFDLKERSVRTIGDLTEMSPETRLMAGDHKQDLFRICGIERVSGGSDRLPGDGDDLANCFDSEHFSLRLQPESTLQLGIEAEHEERDHPADSGDDDRFSKSRARLGNQRVDMTLEPHCFFDFPRGDGEAADMSLAFLQGVANGIDVIVTQPLASVDPLLSG